MLIRWMAFSSIRGRLLSTTICRSKNEHLADTQHCDKIPPLGYPQRNDRFSLMFVSNSKDFPKQLSRAHRNGKALGPVRRDSFVKQQPISRPDSPTSGQLRARISL